MTLGDRIVCMKDGLIQQADTPLNTYNYPVNRFVAGFIGMPPMNFFDGAIKLVEGQMVFVEGKLENAKQAKSALSKAGDEPVVWVGELTLPENGFTLVIPDHQRDALAGKVGSHVVLGLRPEHVHLRPTGEASSPIQVKLNVIEPLGNNMDVYMSTALHDYVVGRMEATVGLTMGVAATVYADARKAHFFEPGATGMNLSLGAARQLNAPTNVGASIVSGASVSDVGDQAHALA
jgi:multiple sugar transport system ATP-binding protein